MHVVLVHGFLDTGRLFRRFARRLSEAGHDAHCPTLSPRTGSLGIADLSAKLEAFIGERVPAASQLALVGFSMGAIVARHYLQNRGGACRARAYFSIAGPHRGTLWAPLGPGLGAHELRRGSPFLRDLDRGLGALGGIPLRTYRTPFDLMVVPGSSTRLPGAPEVITWCPLHALLPRDPVVMEDVAERLAQLEGNTLGPGPKPTII